MVTHSVSDLLNAFAIYLVLGLSFKFVLGYLLYVMFNFLLFFYCMFFDLNQLFSSVFSVILRNAQ